MATSHAGPYHPLAYLLRLSRQCAVSGYLAPAYDRFGSLAEGNWASWRAHRVDQIGRRLNLHLWVE